MTCLVVLISLEKEASLKCFLLSFLANEKNSTEKQYYRLSSETPNI